MKAILCRLLGHRWELYYDLLGWTCLGCYCDRCGAERAP